MKILDVITDHGYPPEYFFARLRARRATLTRDWQPRAEEVHRTGVVDDEDMDWYLLQGELRWSFQRMNGTLREIFQTVFIFMELKTIILCLRYRSVAKGDRIEAVLDRSLLAKEIRAAFLEEIRDVAATICMIVACFGPDFSAIARGEEQKEPELIKRFESALFAWFLQQAIRCSLWTEITFFFRLLIDFRNLMLTAKHKRWVIEEPAQLLPGGFIVPKKLLSAAALHDSGALTKAFPGSWAGDLPIADYPQLEGALLKRIASILTRKSRLGSGISLTLDYLWQRYLSARNGSLVRQAGHLPFELLNEELVQ